MKAMLLTLLFCGLLTGASSAKPSGVTVTAETYKGWKSASRISNGKVDIVIVPQIGRVMAFELTGKHETNPFWQNSALLGKSIPASAPTNWANFGGDKLWPSPQGDWGKHASRAWPPEVNVDAGPYLVTRLASGVKLVGPISPSFGGRFVREITLTPGKAEVKLRDTFEKTQGAAFPLGLWSVTQVKGDAVVYLPRNVHSIFGASGMTSLDTSSALPTNANTFADLIVVTRDPAKSSKIGVDMTGGWMACLRGSTLFSEHFSRPPGEYPDKNTNAQVYANAGDNAYLEMEALGPLAHLTPGQTVTRTTIWRLQKLSRAPKDDAAARVLVKAAMSGK